MTRQTSAKAYRTIRDNGLLSRVRFRIYRTLFREGPMTATECLTSLDKKLKAAGMRGVSFNTHSRFSELRAMGVVHETGKRTCRITGHECIEWDVTSGLPVKPRRLVTPSKKTMRMVARELEILASFNKVTARYNEVNQWLRAKGQR